MSDTSQSIFNKRATEKLRNPDELDKYIRVTNPSVWVVLAACVALLAGLFVWGIFGAVTTSVTATGVFTGGHAMCFLTADDVARVDEGDVAIVDGTRMRVAEVAAVPVSREEASTLLKSDYLVSSLVKGDWAYQVIFDGDTSELTPDIPLTVRITTERITPISLVLGGGTK